MKIDTNGMVRLLINSMFMVVPFVVALLAVFPASHILISEELSLSNTLYMLKYYGVMAYPAHLGFDAMVVHPPLLYYLSGLFYIFTDNVLYSIGATHVLIAIITFGIVYRLRIPDNWKLAYICAFLLMMTHQEIRISIRPLLPIAMMWTAGWLSLDASRQNGWSLKNLAVGSILIGLSAVSHYSAAFSVFGLVVYATLAFLKVPAVRRWKTIASVILPAAMIVAGYLMINVAPNFWDVVHGIRHAPHGTGVMDNIKNHYMIFGIPVSILATSTLIIHPQMRWIGIAVLPVWLFTLLNVFQKYDYWYTEVWFLYFSIIVIAMGRLPKWIWAGLCIVAVVFPITRLQANHFVSRYPAIEKVIRACSKDLIGPAAKVGSRLNLWYVSGASDWLNIQPDLFWSDTVTNLKANRFIGNFDAVAEHSHRCDKTDNYNGKTINNWYLDSTIQLRAFVICNHFQMANDLSMLFLGVTGKDIIVKGYSLIDGKLTKYTANKWGDGVFFSGITDYEMAQLAMNIHSDIPLEKHPIGFNPTKANTAGVETTQKVLFYGVVPRDSITDFLRQYILDSVIDTIQVSCSDANPEKLVEDQLKGEEAIRFFRNYEDWLDRKPLYQLN